MSTDTLSLRVWEVMSRDVLAVEDRESATKAAQTLRLNRVAGMPVINEHMQVVGLIERAALGRLRNQTVGEVMAPPLGTVDEDRPVTEAADLLLQRRMPAIAVVNHGKLVGRLSRHGLVSFLCRHQWVCQTCGGAVRGVVPPSGCPECGGPESGFRLEECVPGL